MYYSLQNFVNFFQFIQKFHENKVGSPVVMKPV